MNRPTCLALLSVVVLIVACAPQASNTASLEAAQSTLLKALNTGDLGAIAALHEENALQLSPNQPMLKGREAIVANYAKGLQPLRDKKMQLEMAHVETVVQGDLGYFLGNYTLTDAAGGTVAQGKYIEIWRKQGDRWMLSRDISNSN